MRAIALLEFRELRKLIAALVFPVFAFAAVTADSLHVLPAYLVLAAAVGVLWGMGQGYQDRRQRKNDFLLHRPLSAMRVHVARTAVGVLACALLMGLVPVFISFFTLEREPRIASVTREALGDRMFEAWGADVRSFERSAVKARLWRNWNVRTLGWPLLTCLLFWAVTRLVFSGRTAGVVFVAAPAAVILTLLAFLRVDSYVFPALAMTALVAASVGLTLLNLMERGT